MSLLTTLGLRANTTGLAIPTLGAHFLAFHFIWAYGVLASRTLKQIYGIDHNVSPREDLGKYGAEAVKAGKITQRQLDQMKRLESASANSIENYIMFTGAMLWAHVAGLPHEVINASGLVYTLGRVAYSAAYVFIDHPKWSQVRGLCWWVGNITCLRLFWLGSKALNARV